MAEEFRDNQTIELALLDPLAWQAVGKTRGWSGSGWMDSPTQAIHNWHRFIDHLADVTTIDEALAAISQGV